MVAMASLLNPIATTIAPRAQNAPINPKFQSSITVTKRRNYLRQKLLKTLTKPHFIPLSPPNPEEPVNPIEPVEPNLEVESERASEEPVPRVIEEPGTALDENESSLEQFQAVQASESRNVESFDWFSGRGVFRIMVSFVGVFVLQTVVSVLMTGKLDSDEKDRSLGIEGRYREGDVGLKGGGGLRNLGYMNVDESEMEAKIAEIRKMAREVRETEKTNVENGEADVDDVSDDEDGGDDDDDLETGSPRVPSGILKEVDSRLTKLKKRSPAPLLNVNLLNKVEENEGVNGKEEDNMLMFEKKPKYRSQLPMLRDKPKGFQSSEGDLDVREESRDVDSEHPVEKPGVARDSGADASKENRELNGSSFSKRSNIGPQAEAKESGTRSSSAVQASKKGFGSNSTTKSVNKSQASKRTSGSSGATKKVNKRVNGGAQLEKGIVQESRLGNPVDDRSHSKDASIIATHDQDVSATSNTHVMSRTKRTSDSDNLGSKSSMTRDTDKQQNDDPDIWWLSLPYVFVVLMQEGPDSNEKVGIFNLIIQSDTKSQSYRRYIVAFENPRDADNFSYLLESKYEDKPDVRIDVIPYPPKILKKEMESVNNSVIVVKKGEVQLYVGQPLAEVESALRSLIR